MPEHYPLNPLSRRSLLGASVVAGGAVFAGCTAGGSQPEAAQSSGDAGEGPAEGGTPAPGDYKESPQLTEQVEAGKLPKVQDRLPVEPLVVRQGELVSRDFLQMEIGKYGGTLQMAQDSPNGDPHIFLGIHEPLIWAVDGFHYDGGFHGNVLSKMTASEDRTTYTCELRQGLKWSDGEPVTMDDVAFAFHDVLQNEKITPAFPSYLRTSSSPEGAPAKFKKIDDWTFSLTFAEPYGAFLALMDVGGWRTYRDLIKPKHYLKKFHKKYADASDLAALLKKNDLPKDQWYNLFNQKQGTGLLSMTGTEVIGLPSLNPFILTKANGGVFEYERNAYYFKVDTEGNQLPYIDKIRAQTVQNKESLTSRALFGEFDYLGSRASMRKLPAFAQKAKAGDVQLFFLLKHTLQTTYYLNLTYDDDSWRSVVRDLRFRQALSLALNRQEIIDNFYAGEFGKLPELINPSEHNPEKANQLLDEMGLDKKDGSGYRLGPDGKRFQIPMEVPDLQADWVPMSELFAEYWKKVGVYTTTKQVDQSLNSERADNNQVFSSGKNLSYPIWPSATWRDYQPGSEFGPLWQNWHDTNGKEGEEPPDEVKRIWELEATMVKNLPASDEAVAAHDEIVKLHHDNLWYFTPVELHYAPTFWSKRVRNIPKGGFNQELFKDDEVFGIIGMMALEQWYLEGKK